MTDSAATLPTAAGALPSPIGTVDHLRLLRPLGQGPAVPAFVAEDTVASRLLAVKVLPAAVRSDAPAASRLRKALVPAAHLSHPAIVPLRHLHEVWEVDALARDLGFAPGMLLLVSDQVRGTPLDQWLARAHPGGNPRRAVLRAFDSLAEALDYAHAAGVAHGALSPGNLLVKSDGRVYLSDLAASRELRHTLAELGLGLDEPPRAAPWKAPETRPDTPATAAEDVYAYTALLIGALAGDLASPAQQHLPFPWLSPAQNSFLAAALSPDPARRPERCGQIATALQVAAADASETATWGRSPGPAAPALAPAATPLRPAALSPTPVVRAVSEAPRPTPSGPVIAAPAVLTPIRPAPPPVAVAPAAVPVPLPVAPAPLPPPTPAAVPAAPCVPAAPAPAAAPAHAPLPRRPSRAPALAVNAALAAALLAVLLLAGLWAWRRYAPAPAGSPAEPAWTTVDEQNRLAPRFAYALTVASGVESPRLKLRLIGQTRRLDLTLDGANVSAREVTGRDRSAVLGQATLPAPCKAADTIAVTATPDSVELFVNGLRAVSAPWPLETMLKAQWQVPPGAAAPGPFRFQRIATLVFADDFMHGEEELGEWKAQSGTWTVHALQNPIRSANPFSFLGRGDDALATAGQWFWRGYRFAAAAHPLPGTSFGAKFCWNAPDLTYEVLWTAGTAGPGTLRLARVTPAGTSELANASLGFVPAQWYRLEVSQVEGSITVSIDGTRVISAVDPNPLLGGAVGLWSKGGEGTVFDDVSVSPVEHVRFDFAKQSGRGVSLLRPLTVEAGAGACVGGVLLENACVSTWLQGLADAKPGFSVDLLARRRGGEELALRLGRDAGGWQARILARQAGRETVLTDDRMTPPGADTRVSLHVLGAEAWATVDGNLVTFASEVPIRGQGIAGVRLPADTAVTQRALEVCPERPLEEIENRVETFEHEASMQNWSSPVLEWNPEYGGKRPTYWHRSDFWQDFSATLRVEDLPADSASGPLGLACRFPEKPAGATEMPTLSLVLDPETRELQLIGLPQGPQALKLVKQRVSELALERRGGRALARLNGRVVWNEPLPDTLRGLCEIGRYGRGNTNEWAEAVVIRAAGAETYPFKHAPAEWFPVRGVWEVTNRWQCDPRWSFYSGVQRGGVACNWNKVRHGPNVTVEFFAGPKMDQDRGRKYEYAADINAVIAADGKDISSGYSFLFGGWDDRGSQIVRGTEIVGENRRIAIPRESSTHRRWFYVKLRKAGNQLSFWIDGSLVATYQDPKPLTGDRFGLWTWDNGIMVAQCRVSSDVTGESVPPLGPAGDVVPKTPYDRP